MSNQRPTKEQIAQARNLLIAGGAAAELASLMGPDMCRALETILAATAEPSEEELAKEAVELAATEQGTAWGAGFRRGYLAGARREGARSMLVRADVERAFGGRCDVCKQVGDHARVCPMIGGLGGAR